MMNWPADLPAEWSRQHRMLLLKLIFDSWGRVAARKLLILLVWGTDFSKV